MTFRLASPATVLALAATVATLASGCSASVSTGGDTIAADDIAQEATTQLTPKLHGQLGSIDCPNDLDAKTGESETCTLTAKDGTAYDMTAEITSVDGGGTAQFHFQVTGKQAG